MDFYMVFTKQPKKHNGLIRRSKRCPQGGLFGDGWGWMGGRYEKMLKFGEVTRAQGRSIAPQFLNKGSVETSKEGEVDVFHDFGRCLKLIAMNRAIEMMYFSKFEP